MNRIPVIVALGAVLALSGCGLFKKKDTSVAQYPGAGQSATDNGDGPATRGAPGAGGYPGPVEIGGDTAGSGVGDSLAGGAAGSEGTGNVVYFDYDSTTINADGLRLVAQQGRYLSENPSARMRLEGHTDERGTREYNVGLGERRANAVHEALMGAGASAAQLNVLSYGEERPVSADQNEAGWAQNRRVQIVRQ